MAEHGDRPLLPVRGPGGQRASLRHRLYCFRALRRNLQGPCQRRMGQGEAVIRLNAPLQHPVPTRIGGQDCIDTLGISITRRLRGGCQWIVVTVFEHAVSFGISRE